MTILFRLKAYIMLHKFDIILLSETYLDSSTPTDDGKLQLPGYALIRYDHRSNTKYGGDCMYYSSLPLRVINIGYTSERYIILTYNSMNSMMASIIFIIIVN